ncbi:MAG: hypothetical protein OXH98_14805 [Caldilineaceae bacterium]|nr:hypothetical protein [Caldilineaceae bacterium]
MSAEVTATTSPSYRFSKGQLAVPYVSAYDPDRDFLQQQLSFSAHLPEPSHETTEGRSVVDASLWNVLGRTFKILFVAELSGSESVRDATLDAGDFPEGTVCVSSNTSIVYSTLPEIGSWSDPWSDYIAEIAEEENKAQQLRQTYESRIDALRSAASLDGLDVNEVSEKDFWAFTGTSHFSRKAGLALMNNGNLRAVWKGEDESHLGLHFLGSRLVQFVIFKRRPGSGRVSRTAGIDTFEGIKKQIRAFGLKSLVNV